MSPPNSSPQRVLEAALRQDLLAFTQRCYNKVVPGTEFLPNWHHEAIAFELTQVLLGKTKRLIITLPPRHMKSIGVSVAFPAFALGHNPTYRIVAASYGEDLAYKHALDCRNVMTSEFYHAVFPNTRLSPDKNAASEYVTTAGGFRYSTSVGGPLTGRGGNLIIIDDPLKPDDALSDIRREGVNAWYDHTLCPRLDNKVTDAIIIVMQRLHQDDLVSHVLKQEEWQVLALPAIAEVDERIQIGEDRYHVRKAGEVLHAAREPLSVLQQIERTMGAYQFSAQYLQEPIPADGNILRWSWFKTYTDAPERDPGDWILQSWDTASVPGQGNDYSVCTTWLVKPDTYYLLHILREQLDYPTLKRTVARHAAEWEADDIAIERAGAGIALIQELQLNRVDGGPTISPFSAVRDKVTRIAVHTPLLESGKVFIPIDAPWLAAFRQEVKQFPHGKHDDQVDSMSQFLYRLKFAPPPDFRYPPAREFPRRDREGWPKPGICFD